MNQESQEFRELKALLLDEVEAGQIKSKEYNQIMSDAANDHENCLKYLNTFRKRSKG